MGDEPKSGLPETLATAYDPGMCPLALPVIRMKGNKKACGKSTGLTCARRFELPTFWSVARRSIQLSYAHMLESRSKQVLV